MSELKEFEVEFSRVVKCKGRVLARNSRRAQEIVASGFFDAIEGETGVQGIRIYEAGTEPVKRKQKVKEINNV